MLYACVGSQPVSVQLYFFRDNDPVQFDALPLCAQFRVASIATPPVVAGSAVDCESPAKDMKDDPDAHLVAGVAAGDANAMQAMVATKLPRLLALATRMLGDPMEAEDVAQETFLRIWKHAGGWRQGNAKFDTWAHRVALNLCYDRLRRRREILVAEPPDQPDQGPLPDAGLLADDIDGEQVQRALQSIAPRQREAIVLVYYQEMSNREASDAMRITVDALESLLSRGRRSLQLILRGEKR